MNSAMTRRLRFLIAFGPTQEPLDPVRYISNNSTGVMGWYLIAAAKARRHKVTAIECPVDARTAQDLEKKLAALLPRHDVLIMAAAVCDVRPASFSSAKIKKDRLKSISLVKNPDILAGLARKKKKGQVFIGFGLESEKLLQNGLKKLKAKRLELIVLQKVTKKETPFGKKPIGAVLLDKRGKARKFGSITKERLARLLVKSAEKQFVSGTAF